AASTSTSRRSCASRAAAAGSRRSLGDPRQEHCEGVLVKRLICALVLLVGTPAHGAGTRPCGDNYTDVGGRETIRFKPGESSATITSGVMSRFRDLYDVTARKGQTLTVKITATENNAVFQICRPDGK